VQQIFSQSLTQRAVAAANGRYGFSEGPVASTHGNADFRTLLYKTMVSSRGNQTLRTPPERVFLNHPHHLTATSEGGRSARDCLASLVMMGRSKEAGMAHIKGLHHNAYRCRDSEETRAWYEDFLGLKLVSAFPIDEGRALHTFFQMDDGSCLAFFEVPGKPFDFKRQDSLDLHIALGVDNDVFERMLQRGRDRAIEVRGPVDHRFCRSIYFRDPNGYIVELTAETGVHQEIMDPAQSKPHEALTRWQAEKHA
jgi:catechol 2,3-dioxygenase-like lactoylglutathione lyase family enzyme